MNVVGWMEEKNVAGVTQLLTENGITFETVFDPKIKHTLFLVDKSIRHKVGGMCAAKFGRFALENQEIELTPNEVAIVERIKTVRNEKLAALEAAKKERDAKWKKLGENKDEDEED